MGKPVLRLILILLIAVQMTAGSIPYASAQRQVPIVRDAEIEALVGEYARPILKAAGLGRSNIKIILVNDPSFNAFVVGRRIFIHTGALLAARSPNEIIGVLAHEAGHIAGGHQERLRQQLEAAQTLAIVAALLGIGVGIAGAATDTGGLAQAGGGIAVGGAEFARRGLLGYQRSEEVTADRSAITYLNRTKQSAKGMLETFQRFAKNLALSGVRVDPYRISHPLPRERIANISSLAKKSPFFDKTDPPALQQRHDMMRAKIAAYTGGPGAVRQLFRKNPRSAAALYGDAISTFLYGSQRSALKKTNALLKKGSKNPFYHELRGEILMKANKPTDAAAAYKKAVALDRSKSGVLKIAYGKALLAAGTNASVKQSAKIFRQGLDRDRELVSGHRYLAQAYGRLGRIPEAELATAEMHFYSGSYEKAKIFALRAQKGLKRGSPRWVQAQDIVNFKVPKRQRR